MASSALVDSVVPVPTPTKVSIKLPRAMFEEVVSKIDEKQKRKKNTNDPKQKKPKVFHKKSNTNVEYEDSTPCSIFSDPSPPSPVPDQSANTQSTPGSSPSTSTNTSTCSSTQSSPMSGVSSLSNSPQSNGPSPSKLISDSPPENQRARDSTKKFYQLLNAVVKKEEIIVEADFENEGITKRLGTLSQPEKKVIAKLLRSRRHFPAEIAGVDGKGTGVRTLRGLSYGQFVCEYAGELITKTEALRREKMYALTSTTRFMSCYMYFFEHGGQEMCIDATAEEGPWGIGRLINHSLYGNLSTVKVVVDGVPRLAFIAKRDIKAGEELSYDYGDRFNLTAFPWLKK